VVAEARLSAIESTRRLRIEAGPNVEGLRRIDAVSRVPTWLPPNGASGLALFDSLVTPASAINDTASAPPAFLTICHAHFLKHGVVEIGRRTPARTAAVWSVR
jgi:hypothetical protein